jgi:hypothetical protein
MDLTTTAGLVEDALKKAGEKIDGTSTYTEDALGYIQALHLAFCDGGNQFNRDLAEPWTWAKSKYPGVLILDPAHTTGSVALVNGSDAGTFSSAPAASMQGRWLKLTDRAELYLISTHIAGATAFVLDSAYADETITASEYQAIKLDYTLATTVLRPINAMNVYKAQASTNNRESKIEGIDFRSFSEAYPMGRVTEGVPTHYTVISRVPGLTTVRFNKFVTAQIRAEYDFIPVPTALTNSVSSLPLIPISFREVLSLGAATKLCIDKSDNRAAVYEKATMIMLQALINAERAVVTQNTSSAGTFYPRQEQLGRFNVTSGSD